MKNYKFSDREARVVRRGPFCYLEIPLDGEWVEIWRGQDHPSEGEIQAELEKYWEAKVSGLRGFAARENF